MRSYKAARRAAERAEGIPFEVVYFDDEGVEHVELFHAYGELKSTTQFDMAENADLDVLTPAALRIVKRVYVECIGDAAEFQRFWAIFDYLDEDTLVEIMQGLIEDVTGRPTQRPEDSAPSSSIGGQPSRVVSLPGGFSTQAQPIASGI